MSAIPLPLTREGDSPEYLPARMVNEFVYCPRLFYYEWVDGVFRHSADTLEGSAQHHRVDRPTGLPAPQEAGDGKIHSRSVTLSSERLRVIAKMDLIEVDGGLVTPVDYKHGKPRPGDEGLDLWPADRVQLALQGIVLRESGYACEEGVIYYKATKQRVRLELTAEVVAEAEAAVAGAWTAARGRLPEPLEDSPKCPGCSLVGICLPDETNALLAITPVGESQLELFSESVPRRPAARAVRALTTPRYEQRPVYLNTQGLRVGKSGEVLQIREKERVVQEVRLGEMCQLNLMGNVQVTTQAVQQLCECEVPICYFSQGGWFYGITTGMGTKNVFLRREQFRLADEPWFALRLARALTAAKIRNQRVLLQRNHVEPPVVGLAGLRRMAEAAERARNLEELLGVEGNAARIYFGAFAGMLKLEENEGAELAFDFAGRNRRPPRDPVNALLSLGYSLLAKDLTVACYAVGFDPMLGFYHQPRFGRPALALDLMEPFRPLVADSAVLSAINTRMVTPGDFVRAGGGVALSPGGRKSFFRAYELRMDTLVTHPLFDYRVSYRRLLEIQSRLLARVVEGEMVDYPAFVTR